MPIANQQPEPSSHEAAAQRHYIAHQQKRMDTAAARLEREARRMLQIEEELSGFANRYYDAVGDAVERLCALEERLHGACEEVVNAMPAVLAQRDARSARRSELKVRYRGLAKEAHPDRAALSEPAAGEVNRMHALNAAYQQGDLAGLLRLEAEMELARVAAAHGYANGVLDATLREVDRAADTYAAGYRILLNSPLNELMLRDMQARLAGLDWMGAVVRKIERSIEETQRAAAMEHIGQIGAWREQALAA
jgi:hypothetical protein